MRKPTKFLTILVILGTLCGSYMYAPRRGGFRGGGMRGGRGIRGGRSHIGGRGTWRGRGRGRRHWRRPYWRRGYRRGGLWGPRVRFGIGFGLGYGWRRPYTYWGAPIGTTFAIGPKTILPVYYPGYAYWCPFHNIYHKWGYECPDYLGYYGRFPWY